MPLRNFSYRSLELLCRKQAELSSTPEAAKELEAMAREYRALADHLEKAAFNERLDPAERIATPAAGDASRGTLDEILDPN